MRWLMALCALAAGGAVRGEESLALYYYERPPFVVRQADGTLTGLIGSRITALVRKADIPVRWQLMPANRQLHLLRTSPDQACGIGWYRTAERREFAQFSHPIYRDRGTVVIANPELARRKSATLAALLQDSSVSVLFKEGLTYGPGVARLIRSAKARIETVTIEQPQMVRMIASGRASLMFATREEAEMLLTRSEPDDEGVVTLAFADLPATGEARYLMCSGTLPAAILDKINAAIDSRPPP